MIDPAGVSVGWAYNQITDASKIESVKPCIDVIRNGLAEAINEKKEDW